MQPFYVGVDVSKGYADFMIIDRQKNPVIKGFQLDDTFNGHRCLYETLEHFIAEHPDASLFVGMESTGGYENNWYQSLTRFQGALNIQTARLNPFGVMHNSKADLKKNTTDKISAQNIAEYLVAHPEKVAYQKEDQLSGLRRQWGFIQMLTKQCSQLLNQFNSLMYTACPELLHYCQNGVPDWVLKLLVQYPGSAKLKRAHIKSVARIPYVTQKRAQQLVSEAKNSVASTIDPAIQQLIIATARQILYMRKTIADQTKQLVDQCNLPEVELLKSFPGISNASAVGLLIEIQTIKRFANVKKLASFFGIHPVYKISGDGIGGIKMSKQGRKAPRQILYMIALSAIQHSPLIRQVYEKHLEQGTHRMAALGICMHKILRIVYGMLKNNKPYDPQIDMTNQQRCAQIENTACDKAIHRRFQTYDANAPISRRQRKKRLERERPHRVDDAKIGVTTPVPFVNIS